MRPLYAVLAIVILPVLAAGGLYLYKTTGGSQGDAAAELAMRDALPPLATLTPETTALPNGMRLYKSEAFHFSLAFPQELKVTQYTERDNAMTVTFENPDHSQEFEIYVTPYNKTQIDQARFKLDEPSGTFLQPQDVVVDGTTATMFFGRNGIMGDTREVWFIKGGFLYEVATYKALDSWLGQVMQGWKFI